MVQSYNPSHKFSLETVRRNLWEDEAQRRRKGSYGEKDKWIFFLDMNIGICYLIQSLLELFEIG